MDRSRAVPQGLIRELRSASLRGEPLLAAFDFDGVLAPIRRHPARARMSERTRGLIRRLGKSEGTTIMIVSGRAIPFLRAALTGCGVALAGDHGLAQEGLGAPWRHHAFADLARHARALARAARRETRLMPGVEVELKTTSISVHWRRSPAVKRDPEPLRKALVRIAPPGWRVSPGLMVWELRPKLDWGKGHIIERGARLLGARPLFVGDDFTDEEGFRRLGPGAWTVRVGPGPSAARWRLPGVEAVDDFLRALVDVRRAAPPRRTSNGRRRRNVVK